MSGGVAGFYESNSNGQKRDGGEGEEIANRISALPDAILTYLLSFLRTKEAVRTCVLSKRWESAWTSVFNLDFNEALDIASDLNEWENVQYFREYVDGVLGLHDCLFIKKFTLDCEPNHNSLLIYKWISAATIRHVEELHITIQGSLPPEAPIGPLPYCLYTCERLKVLKIKGNFVLRIPALMCLNRLQVLWLKGIEIPDESSMKKLLDGTPLLDELHLSRFSSRRMQTIYICSPTLKRLFIQDDLGCVNATNQHIVVDSPSLELVDLYCIDVILRSSPSLVSANIALNDVKLLDSISNSVRLQIRGFTKDLFEDSDVELQIPIFPNLKHLEIQVWAGAWQYVPRLLQRCPNLASLGVTMLDGYMEDKSDPFDHLPSCLEEVMIRDFRGNDSEKEAIRCLLAKSKVLKKMTIFPSHYLSEMLQGESSSRCVESHRRARRERDLANFKNALVEVIMFPRSSTSCEIAFPSSSVGFNGF